MTGKENRDPFIMTRKRRDYSQKDEYPMARVNKATYDALQRVAIESESSMSEVTRKAVAFAMDRLEWCD